MKSTNGEMSLVQLYDALEFLVDIIFKNIFFHEDHLICMNKQLLMRIHYSILLQSDWIPAQKRAGSGEGGCVDTPVLSGSADASEMTYVASIHASHVSYVHVDTE
jgi:hypothetical protein